MNRSILRIGLLFFTLTAPALIAADEKPSAPPVEKHKTGRYQLESKGVPAKVWLQAAYDYGAQPKPEAISAAREGKIQWVADKDKKYTYEVAAPKTYQPGVPHGVLVYVSPTDGGEPPAQYNPLLAKHRLIAIGANDSGNEKDTLMRHGFAVHAVELLKERYDIDPARIYITGVSGGGRVASQVMLMNSDLFTGGVPLVGANACIPMLVADSKGKRSPDPGAWKMQNPKLLARAATESRFVFMTGEKDFNRPNVKSVFEGYQQKGFKNVAYLEEPGLGHAAPSADWFEKALDFLDAPLKEDAKKRYESAKAAEARKQFGAAMEGYAAAAAHGGEADFTGDAAAKAQSLREKYDGAVKEIETLIEKEEWPKAQQSIAPLRTQWGKAAETDAKRLAEEIRQARLKATK